MSFLNHKKQAMQQHGLAALANRTGEAVNEAIDITAMSLSELRKAYVQLQQTVQQLQAPGNTTTNVYTPEITGPLTDGNIVPLPLNNGQTSSFVYFNADMVCEFANEEFNAWLPKGIQQAAGCHHSQFLSPEIFAEVLPYIQLALNGQQSQFERRGLFEQTRYGWVRVQYIPVKKNDTVIGYYSIVTNITAAKKMEAELAFEHANTLALINNTNDYIWSFGHDLKLISANTPCKQLIEKLGVGPFTVGMDVLPPAHFLPSGNSQLVENCRRVLAGETFVSEDRLVIEHLGKEIFLETSFCPIIEQGKVVAAAAFTRDITARKKELQRLKLLESAITNTKDIVMITKAEPFGEPGPAIEYVNPAFTTITGYSAEEAIGRSPRFLQGPGTDRQQLKDLRASMEKWQPGEVTTLNYTKSGEPFWVNFSVHPVADETGWFTHWVSVERDVTAQKNAEQVVLNSLNHLENYTQAVEKGTNMVIFNLDGIITFVNDRFCQLSKYTREELVGSPMMLLASDQITAEYGQHFWATVMAGKVFRDRMKKTAKDGSFFWVDAILTPFINTEGEVYQVLAIDTDITQTKLAEEALQLSNDRFNLAAKATLDVIWDWDIANKQMYYSDAFETLLGYRSGLHPFDLQPQHFTNTHPDDVGAVIQSMQQALTGNATRWQQQFRLKGLGGEYLSIIDRGIIIRNAQGVAVRMVGAMQDVTAQTLSEKALVETNILLADYKQALDEANLVFIAGADGIIKYANKNLCQTLQYSRQELEGSHINILKTWPKDDPMRELFWQAMHAGKIFKTQKKNVAKNGQIYWVDATVTPFMNGDGNFYQFLSIETDITQTKLAEEALQVSNDRFNQATKATLDVIWDWDIAKNEMYLSEASETLLGSRPGIHPFNLQPEYFTKTHPNDVATVIKSMQTALNSGSLHWQHQYRLTPREGEETTIIDRAIIIRDAQGLAVRMVGAMQDVTLQRLSEKALMETNRLLADYKQALDEANLVFIAGADGTLKYANNKLCEISGYTQEELIGSHISIFKSPDHSDAFRTLFWQTLRAGKVFKAQIKNYTKTGNFYWVDTTVTPFLNNDREVYQFLAIETDITQTKLAEEALQVSNDRFNQAAKATLDIIWDWNIAAKEVYYSDACERLLGQPGGIHSFDLQPQYFANTHPNDVTAIINSMQLALGNGTINWQHQYRLKTISGEYGTFINRGIIIRDAQGLAVRMVGAMQDVTVQRLSEKALMETNMLLADYKHALDEANMVLIADANGILKYANNKLCEISGYTNRELIGSHLSIFKSSEYSDAFHDHIWQTLKLGKIFKAQIKNRAKNGSYYWVDTTVTPFLNSKGKVYQILAIETDITQAKLAEEALEASNQRFNLAIGATMDVIWDWDIDRDKLFLSDAFTTNFGHEAGWRHYALTPDWFSAFHPADADALLASLQNALDSKDVFWEHQYRLIKSNGEYANISDRAVILRDENGRALRMVGAKRDITEQVQQAEKEQAQQQRFREMVYNVDDIITILDEKGLVLYSSPALKKVTGLDPDEVVGLKSFSLAHPEDYAALKQNHADLLQKHGNGRVIEVRYRHTNGHYINIEIQGNNQLHNPAINGIILTTRDVTARNQKETERRELLYELMRKNTDLRQFSYLAGHHLRAPLTNLTAICTLLDVEGLAPSETHTLLNAFKTSTLKINDVLDDIIKILLVKDSAPAQVTEVVDLQQAFDAALLQHNHAITANGATVTADFSQAKLVQFKQEYMQEIFAELICNAIQFAQEQCAAVINISASATNGTVDITVADNGTGMDMDKVKNKVFGLYQRFTNIGAGRGLGLYMAQAKLAMFGYPITVQSAVGLGTSFTMRLKTPNKKY